MNPVERGSTIVDALRLGLEPERVERFTTSVTLQPETLIIRSSKRDEDAPLVLCLHPPRFNEFQFAQKARGLTTLQAHIAFPRGLYPHLVDLGGARTVGYSWLHYTGNNPAFHESLAVASDYLDRVMDQLLNELAVDRRSIYLLGAEGASLCAALHAVRRSTYFAGVVAIGGDVFPDLVLEEAGESHRIPMLWIYNRRGRIARSGDARSRADELNQAGFAVDLDFLHGDDAPWHEEEALIISWLSQKAGIPAGESA